MNNKKILNLYIGNHGKPAGIEDYVKLITDLMGKRNIQVNVSSILSKDHVNLIIDEFTNYSENDRVKVFKKANPDSKIVYVLTEFAVRKCGVESFNHFGNLFDSAAISLFDVYLRMVRNDFGCLGVWHWLRLLCYLPLLVLETVFRSLYYVFGRLIGKRLKNPVAKYLITYHRIIYFHMRYLGLKAHLRYADAAITSHEKIMDGFRNDKGADGQPLYDLGVLYPEFDERDVLDKLMLGKKLCIEISGSVTSYRKKLINRINRKLVVLGLHNVFGPFQIRSFSEKKYSNLVYSAAYSLHPPQTRNWAYCSPTRIFRALSVDNNLPILTHHFRQNPIEDVCFIIEGNESYIKMVEMYANPSMLKNFIEPRIRIYNQIAVARNDALVEKLCALMMLEESTN